MEKREKARKFFVDDGYGVGDIAKALNIQRATIYYYKKTDLEKGIDWDELRYIATLNPEDTHDKEKMFLSVLIQEFNKALIELKNSEVEDKLYKLEQFAKTYYRLKVPDKETGKKLKKDDIAKDVIKKIVALAVDQENMEVAEFLKDNAETIVEDIISNA